MVVGIILFTLMMRKSVREYLTSFYETGGSRISTRIVIGVVIGVAIGIAAFGYGYSSGIIGVPAVERSDVPISEDPFALTIQTQTVVEGLGTCGTSFVFAPDKRIFCVEVKSGKVRVIENFQLLQEPLIELDVHFDRDTRDERGLIGITIDPEFERNHYVYLHWTYLGSDDQTYKRVARFTESNNKLTNMTILLDKIPGNWNHNGGPLEFGYDGKLYITTGDARDKEPRAINENAQNMTLLAGKILRINSDGTIPDDNPFPGSPIYTLGHRNVFGIGFDPVTKLPYVTENGQTFCDEVNVLHPGKNYGWPYVVFDECAHDQGLGFIPKSFEASLEGEEGFTKPYIGLTSNVVPTELVFYTGDKYPPEVNNMFFLSYINRELHRVQNPHLNEVLSMKTYEIRFEGEDMLHGLGGRLYNGLLDIEQGPDGYLYVSSFDRIMRLDFNYTNVKTIVSISVRPDAKDEDSRKLTARISDYFGNAVSDVPVEFFESNRMIGSSVSNLEGVAELEYTIGADDDPTIIAKFAGNERYRASSSPPTTSGWTIAADMPTPRDEVRAGAIGSKIYVVGGFEISTTQASNIVE
ncbi:MAG: PQQ-dependent sugar dehydrogenase, partial [Nitrososphaerales archaeon]